MKSKFRIRICSDLDYEEMVVDICYENYKIATINQEMGIKNMQIEIFTPSGSQDSWEFPLDEFVEFLLLAKRKLIEMQRPES